MRNSDWPFTSLREYAKNHPKLGMEILETIGFGTSQWCVWCGPTPVAPYCSKRNAVRALRAAGYEMSERNPGYWFLKGS